MGESEFTQGDILVELKAIRRELTTIRQLASDAVNYIRDAESEVPEKYRRFVNAFHDVHHIGWVYEEKGHPIPEHVRRELERLDDRYRQIISELNAQGGTFDKVRREMASDPLNRWDHTRQLPKPTHVKETKHATGLRNNEQEREEGRTEGPELHPRGSEPDRGELGEPRDRSGEDSPRSLRSDV